MLTWGNSEAPGRLRCVRPRSLADAPRLTVDFCACRTQEPSTDMYRNLYKTRKMRMNHHVRQYTKLHRADAACACLPKSWAKSLSSSCPANASAKAGKNVEVPYRCRYDPRRTPFPRQRFRSWACVVPSWTPEVPGPLLRPADEAFCCLVVLSQLSCSRRPHFVRRERLKPFQYSCYNGIAPGVWLAVESDFQRV